MAQPRPLAPKNVSRVDPLALMQNSLWLPNVPSPALAPGGSSRDVKQFTVTFACNLVGADVQFGWNEVAGASDDAGSIPHAEQVICSGIGRPLCAVRNNPDGQTGWENCPRMQRLALRLRNAVQLTHDKPTAGDSPGWKASEPVEPPGVRTS